MPLSFRLFCLSYAPKAKKTVAYGYYTMWGKKTASFIMTIS